jgi:hypothetical protein
MPAGSPLHGRRPARPAIRLAFVAVAVLAVVVVTLAAAAGSGPRKPALWIASGPGGRVELHGGWAYAADPGDRGIAAGWPAGRFAARAVSVPYSPNAGAITGRAGVASFEGSVGWYRRSLSVGRTGAYALRFESVNHVATVWIDGREVTTHVGTYLPFEARVRLTAGRAHTLVVRADWRSPEAMKRAAWHRTWFNFGGVNREVSLRPVGRSEIFAPNVRTRLRGGTAAVDLAVPVVNDAPRTRALGVHATLARGASRISLSLPARTLRPGERATLRGTVRVEHPALWAPGSPRLYDLDLAAGDPGATDEGTYHVRVGLRELTWRGGDLRLNGRPLVLRGASLQEDVAGRGDALRPADQAALVRELRSIGANATRSQHPLDEGLLERLDAAGILVWQGVGPVDAPGSWTSNTPALRREAHLRVMATVRQAQAHPSIVAWNLVNEVAGNGHDAGEVAYVRDAARSLHRDDPGRPVAVDVWGQHPPAVMGELYRDVDAVGVTNYLGWYEPPLGSDPSLAQAIRDRIARMRRVFAGKVLVVSEFGAEANPENPRREPGGYAFQSRLLATHIDAYRTAPGLAGMLVWDLRDFAVAPAFGGGSISRVVPGIHLVRGLNQKGLLSYAGTPKPSVVAVRAAFARVAAAQRARGGY